jgi:Raf kinase inhibitor-like YbhB/YbcL family protein
MTIQVKSSAFADGVAIPKTYTCDGREISPPLSWSGVPEKAKSLTLICDDPDAPMGTFTHWLIYNMSPQVKELPEGRAPGEGAREGKNDFKKTGYGGPCPPSGTHHYRFTLYALDTNVDLPAGATRDQVQKALKGHVLAKGRLVGTYSRRS